MPASFFGVMEQKTKTVDMLLSRFPRVSLAHLPTPLEHLPRLEGLLFDPVYSGKALAGLIDLIRNGHFRAGSNVVFLHMGGSAALFADADQLDTDHPNGRETACPI